MNAIKGFDKIGLTPRDSRVYVALLQMGVSSIRAVSDKTGINRGSTYDSVKALMGVGLVNYQQANVNKKYFAEEPSKITEIIKQRQDELTELENETKKIIPNLVRDAAYLPYANIRFYEDHEGIANILRDVINTLEGDSNPEYLAISSKPMRSYLYKKFPQFTKQRIDKGIYVKVIAIGDGGDEAEESERRWLKTTDRDQPTSYTLVYGNKVAILALNDSFNPYGVVIEDVGAAAMQRLLFQQLWSSLK